MTLVDKCLISLSLNSERHETVVSSVSQFFDSQGQLTNNVTKFQSLYNNVKLTKARDRQMLFSKQPVKKIKVFANYPGSMDHRSLYHYHGYQLSKRLRRN